MQNSVQNTDLTQDGAKPIDILLIEDNPGDVRLTREALDAGRLRNNLYVVDDGATALAYLQRREKYQQVPRPDIILLDLNLPKKSGVEVLREIKQDPDLKRIPVIVLTSSSSEIDILETSNLHANCYITKPFGLEQLIKIVQGIEDFWFTLVTLPTK